MLSEAAPALRQKSTMEFPRLTETLRSADSVSAIRPSIFRWPFSLPALSGNHVSSVILFSRMTVPQRVFSFWMKACTPAMSIGG